MNNILLVFTVAGEIKTLKNALKSLNKPDMDVLVVDDGTSSNVGIEKFCKGKNIKFIGKEKALGLTDSWNRAYKYFKKSNYEYCILSNDDVSFPKNFHKPLIELLKFVDLAGPLSNNPGHAPWQQISKYTNKTINESTINDVQEELSNKKLGYKIANRHINGFCFAFNKSIEKFEFSKDLLFDPKYLNVGNEDELCRRIKAKKGKMGYTLEVYVYHYKDVTFSKLKSRKTDTIN